MNTPERLNYEIRDSLGNIVAATHDRGIAEIVTTMVPRTEIYECRFSYSHKAWFPCDFSAYYRPCNPAPEVVIENTLYRAKKLEVEV